MGAPHANFEHQRNMVSAAIPNNGTAPNHGTPHPRRERPRPVPPAVEAEEAQWLFTEEELAMTPSIIDGMTPAEERTLRRKGITFITQVGVMLKLPQTTLSTAAVFLNRYITRNTLKQRPGHKKPLHHYEIAATTLFLATKVEETCRKLKELVVACVRVALRDPNKLVDEQTKDYWRWRDTILYSEDVVLESLCFDLSVEPPYKPMYDMIKYLGLQHDKRLRNAAWAFLSDADLTQLCLLFSSRTVAAASLYVGAKVCDIEIPHEDDGTPWWEVHYVKLGDIRRAVQLMLDIYEQTPGKDGENNMYQILRNSEEMDASYGTPRSTTNGESNTQGQIQTQTQSESQSQTQSATQSQQQAPEPPADGEDVAMGNAEPNGAAAPPTNAPATAEPAPNGTTHSNSGEGSHSEEGELSG